MHLVDRSAFAHFGVTKRDTFAERFEVMVLQETLSELNKDVSADDFGKLLRDTYNRRQIQYANYKGLVPNGDEPPKDTLCWEFTKTLFSFLNTINPVTFAVFHSLVLRIKKVMLQDTLKAEEVLRG
jgi:hypothetical protein